MKDTIDVPAPDRDDVRGLAPGSFAAREADEDDVQEALLRLIARAGPAPDSPRAWLARVTRNVAIDRWRRARLERAKLALLVDRVGGVRTPEAELVRTEACRDVIRALLADSGPEEVAAVLLREVFGLSYAEIARVGGRNDAAWRQAVRRALERARARAGSHPDGWTRPEAESVREADAVPLRFQRAVLMADPAMLLDVLRVSADGPPGLVDAAVPSPRGLDDRARTRFELDAAGARVSLVLGGTVLCTLRGTSEASPSAGGGETSKRCRATRYRVPAARGTSAAC